MISRTTDVFPVSKRNLGSLIPFLSFMPFFSFYMITLVQLVVLGLEAWASRLLALTICTGTSTGDCMVIRSQKYFSGMNPPVFNTNAGAHLTNGGMHSFSSFFLILFIISDDLFLSTQISGPSMDCKDKEIGLLGAFTSFSYNPKQNLSCENA